MGTLQRESQLLRVLYAARTRGARKQEGTGGKGIGGIFVVASGKSPDLLKQEGQRQSGLG